MSRWRAFGLSEVGLVRRRNEDAFAVEEELGLFLVADGMGGHPAGDVASRLARDRAVAAVAEALRDGPPADPRAMVAAAVTAANRAVFAAGDRDPALAGMGTTLTLLWLGESERGVAGHVGDSRLYALRDGRLVQLTEDHTQAAELVRSGRLHPAEARGSFFAHMLTRALGLEAEVAADVFAVPLAGVSAFLLCTDGLYGPVDDATIGATLAAHRGDPEAACRALIAETIAAGAPDNVTAVVLCRA